MSVPRNRALGHAGWLTGVRSMDLFDCGRYFSFHVPVRARTNALLKNAACAYAAKHLGRVQGRRTPFSSGNASWQAATEVWPEPDQDWYLVGCRYYDRALELVLEALAGGKAKVRGGTDTVGTGSMDGDDRTTSGGGLDGDNSTDLDDDRTGSHAVRTSTSDELLAATAILCEYEAMDMSDAAWSRHLNGTKSLLDIAELGMRPAGSYDLLEREAQLFAGSRKAIFWNFARQDFCSACK